MSRCHANVVPVIGLGAVCVFDDNGRIREEKHGFFALYGVGSWRIMIDPLNDPEIFYIKVFSVDKSRKLC